MSRPWHARRLPDDGSAAMRQWRQVLRWTPKIRRQRAIEAVWAWQDEERAAARQRIVGVAAILDRPLYAQPRPPEQRRLVTCQDARTRLSKHSNGRS